MSKPSMEKSWIDTSFPEAITKYSPEITEDSFKEIRKLWDPEKEKAIDKQIRAEQFVEVEDKNGNKIKMEVRFLDGTNTADEEQEKPKKTLVIISGWGSSYKRLSETAKVIALEGKRKIVLLSMPGVGNSDDPPEEWLQENNFDMESDVAIKTFEHVRKDNGDSTKEIDLLGYSMGGIQATQIAKEHPEMVKTLILLHTAGIKKEPPVDLMTRFILSGAYENAREFSKYIRSGFDQKWLKGAEKYVSIAGKIAENMMTKKRFLQHFGKEIKVLSNGKMPEMIKDVKSNIIVLSGSKEKLFPPEETGKLLQSATNSEKKLHSIMLGGNHASPMLWHDIYGINIAHYLDEAEKEV